METPGFSPWIVLILFAMIFLIFWGALLFALAFGAWIIARTRLPDDRPRPREPEDWEAGGGRGG
jgi:hypothetical protein